jgi:hypothetical protein
MYQINLDKALNRYGISKSSTPLDILQAFDSTFRSDHTLSVKSISISISISNIAKEQHPRSPCLVSRQNSTMNQHSNTQSGIHQDGTGPLHRGNNGKAKNLASKYKGRDEEDRIVLQPNRKTLLEQMI